MIRCAHIRVDYDAFTAVSDLDLTIPAGEIFGLIGPNGAGKSSTIRVLATLQVPTLGTASIAGYDLAEQRQEVQRVLGYMPDDAPVYDALRIDDFLHLFATAYLPDANQAKKRVEEVLDLVRLQERRGQKAGTLSRGLKQRLVLAKTLLHDPLVLLLDEPASGLDPKARIELREIIREVAARQRTVLISSHILTEMEGFCTSIGIMARGKLLISGPIDEVIDAMTPARRFVVRLLSPPEPALTLLAEIPQVLQPQLQSDGSLHFSFTGSDAEAAAVLSALVGAGAQVLRFAENRMNVEDVYLQIGAQSEGEQA